MSSSLNNLLSQAYGFIEADQLDDAITLLKPILAENPNNPDAWWLYAHAVENVDDARAALQTVLNLSPNYPEAQRLLDMLEEATAGVDTGNPLNDISLQPIRTISDAEAGVSDDDAPFGDMGERTRRGFEERMEAVSARKSEGFPFRNIALLAALFIFAMIAALIFGPGLFNPFVSPTATDAGDDRTATALVFAATGTSAGLLNSGTTEPAVLTATAIVAADSGGSVQTASSPTSEAALAVTPVASATVDAGSSAQAAASPTPEVLPGVTPDTSIDLSALSAALVPLGDGTAVGIETTSRGETVVLTLCSQEPNVSLRDTLRQAVDLLAGQTTVTDPQVGGVGFRLLDCTTDSRILRFLAASASDVVEYAGGVIDAAVFEARLAPQ